MGRRSAGPGAGGVPMSTAPPLLEVRGIAKQYPGVRALNGRRLRRPRRRGALPAGPERRRQVDADQVRIGRGRAHRGRDPRRRRAAADRRAVGVAGPRRRDDLSGARPGARTCASPRACSSVTSRAASGCSTGPGCGRDDGAAQAPGPRRHPAGHARADPAPRRTAGGLDRPGAVAQRAAADHGRAVGDPRRRRDRGAVRRRPAPGRRRRRRDLHLPPPRRDPPDRRPRHGARPTARTVATGLPADTPPASWSRRWSAAGSISCSRRGRAPPRTSCSTSASVAGRPTCSECSFQVRAGEVRRASAGSSAPGARSCCG